MKFLVNHTEKLSGTVRIPGNKSGTARGVILGVLAEGESTVTNPLLNLDSFSIIDMMEALGAKAVSTRNNGLAPLVISGKLKGGRFQETEDTMTIYHSDLKGAFIDGHHDHRIVMATAMAALVAEGPTIISDSEYAAVSFPEFYDVMRQMGARIERLETL